MELLKLLKWPISEPILMLTLQQHHSNKNRAGISATMHKRAQRGEELMDLFIFIFCELKANVNLKCAPQLHLIPSNLTHYKSPYIVYQA